MTVQPALLPVFNACDTDIDLVKKLKYIGLPIGNSLTWGYQLRIGKENCLEQSAF